MTPEDLIAWRKAEGYRSRQDAADALGVPFPTYRAWEQGKRRLSPLLELATAQLTSRRRGPSSAD